MYISEPLCLVLAGGVFTNFGLQLREQDASPSTFGLACPLQRLWLDDNPVGKLLP